MNKLRYFRVVKRITQFQLRLLSGIHQSRISLIENGFIEPRSEEKRKLAEALEVGIEEMFGGETEKSGVLSRAEKSVDPR